jgi:hypothetical protein
MRCRYLRKHGQSRERRGEVIGSVDPVAQRSRREERTHDGTSTKAHERSPAVSYSIPPPEHPHTWAELLTLVGAIRRIAYDVTLEAGDALRRIRDLYADYDGA